MSLKLGDTKEVTAKDAIALISDKWSIEVLHGIGDGANRYGELKRHIPDITKKMLTQTLRKLERNGIIKRIEYDENPLRVEYFITPVGQTLVQQLTLICTWSRQNFEKVEEAREIYDTTQDS